MPNLDQIIAAKRVASPRVLENPMNATLIKGALKTLTWVALVGLDFRLAAITKQLELWVKKQEREIQEEKDRLERDLAR